MKSKILIGIIVLSLLFVILFPATAKKCTPVFVKTYIKDLLGITELQEHIKVLENIVYESKEDVWSRSRQRWENTAPDAGLTWGKEITGDAFIEKAIAYKVFGKDKVILEIGPGYGRLLRSMQKKDVAYKNYIGVDISEEVCDYLRKEFTKNNIEIIHADVEKLKLPVKVDVVISSLTFKHLYPTFEKAILNLNNNLNSGGLYIFDLLEGEGSSFENDGKTYIHRYTQKEVIEILARCGLELLKFDEVKHDADHTRLLVIAKKK
ncbi:MAG TPA: class I SAM-dependent methyltransferase [Bacteroidia bacterium]|jgi:SAM-dependent methyltransferase|nr:class I SAM-dependent methyltransferase [Bacteroidia bacterium]